MFTLSCRRCSSVVEHVIGNDGVASPILASGTIFKISAPIADFLFLNKCLFSPIFEVLKMAIFAKLSDFLRKSQENKAFHLLNSSPIKMIENLIYSA